MKARIAFKEFSAAVVPAALVLAAQPPAQTACAQQAAAKMTDVYPMAISASPAKHKEEKQHSAQPAKPGDEGIEVHGHWVIDVRNPEAAITGTMMRSALGFERDHLHGPAFVGGCSGGIGSGRGCRLVLDQVAVERGAGSKSRAHRAVPVGHAEAEDLVSGRGRGGRAARNRVAAPRGAGLHI